MYFILYQDIGSFWRWTLYAANDKKIADCGESFVFKADAEHAIKLIKATNVGTPVYQR